MQVKILTNREAANIPSDDWDKLAELSENINPFYERWCLLPALKYIDKENQVSVVVVYEKKKLICLFPIHIKRHYLGIRYLTVWQHSQCFLCEPLCIKNKILSKVLQIIMSKNNVSITQLPIHTPFSFGSKIDQDSISFNSSRGSVTDFSKILPYFENLPSRIKLENRRITNRLFKITGATYINSDMEPERDWLHDYCQLENSGWKGRSGGAILSSPEIYAYYQDMCGVAKGLQQVEFQGLFNNNETLAISMRIYSKNRGFDLKTSYNELFKEFYPGVVLEISNLKAMLNSQLGVLDSCASSNNRVINRLWPEQRNIKLSYYFARGIVGKILHLMYKLKHRKTE